MSRNFTHQKRIFLLYKLYEVIIIWATGSSQGSFNFTVRDDVPALQFDLKFAMEDFGNGKDPVHHHQQHHANVQRHRGPARQAKDRLRAAKH